MHVHDSLLLLLDMPTAADDGRESVHGHDSFSAEGHVHRRQRRRFICRSTARSVAGEAPLSLV